MTVASHPWYFETDSPVDALAARTLLERYLAKHAREGSDLFPALITYGELVSNVAKHAPSGGVRVWLDYEDSLFALCINDDGQGFSDEQVRSEPDSGSESGRGLFIVKQVCRAVHFGRCERGGFLVRAVLPLERRAG